LGDDPRKRRLPRSRRPVEDQRRHPVLLDREAQRSAWADDVLLAGEVGERRRTQPLRERRGLGEAPACGLAAEGAHPGSMLADVARVWSVGSYERIAARLAPVQDHLTTLLSPRAGEDVLDAATGTGEVAIRAARTGANVTAIDISEPMLEKARRR